MDFAVDLDGLRYVREADAGMKAQDFDAALLSTAVPDPRRL